MSEKTYQTTDGSCIISEDVIASIACNAALEVPGVVSMAQRPMNVRNVIKTGAVRSIGVISNANETVLDVYINVSMTVHVPTVSEKVQTDVKAAVQSMTGNPVTKVNVHVVGAVDEQKDAQQQAE